MVGSSSRADLSSGNVKFPGPGQYSIPDTKSKTSFKFGSSTNSHKSLFNEPGPGAYQGDPEKTKSKNPSWKVGTSKRAPLAKTARVPGPGNYEVSDWFSTKKNPNWVFGTEERGKDMGYNKMNPGPG